MQLRKCNVFERACGASSKNRGALATTIFEMQEFHSCDTHNKGAVGILYSLTWSQIDVKNYKFCKRKLE